jgi:hypothetical protein
VLSVGLVLAFGWSLPAGSLVHNGRSFKHAAAESCCRPAAAPSPGPFVAAGPAVGGDQVCLACELGCISLFGLEVELRAGLEAGLRLTRALPPAAPHIRLVAADVRLRAPPLLAV